MTTPAAAPDPSPAHGTSFDPILTLASILDATPGSHAVLLGAGISVSAGVPSAWGVQQELIRRIARGKSATEALDEPHEWYEEQFETEATYASLLESLAPTQDARQALMREYFEPETLDPEKSAPQPSLAHQSLARLAKSGKLHIFLTLNFDHLMEKALRDEGIEPVVVRTVEDIAGLAPLHTLRVVVVHLHGDYLSPQAMRNTDSELATYGDGLDAFIANVLRDHALLAVGWSAEYDTALRALVDAHLLERYTSYWIDLATLKPQASALADRKRFVRVQGAADEKVGRLADAVDAIADRQARHSLSLAEAVSSTKRDLTGRQVAIDSHDRLREELTRLREHPDLTQPISELEKEPRSQIIDRLTEATIVPAALVATAAYWGDERSDRWWFDDLRRFSAKRMEGGATHILALPRLCGTLLFQAAYVSAVAAGRYDMVVRLYRASADDPSHTETLLWQRLLAARSHPNKNRPSAAAMAALAPIFVRHLALGTRAFEETWELSEILAAAHGLAEDARFAERRDQLLAARRQLAAAEKALEEAHPSGVVRARERLVGAQRDAGRALGVVAECVNVLGMHVRFEDRVDEPGIAPAAERLLSEVRREGARHPLVVAGVGGSSRGDLEVALEAVSIAIGHLGNGRAWAALPSGGGFGVIPTSMWVDTGQERDY